MAKPSKPTISKPSKPRPDYPLLPHANGQWYKKILGRVHYFGKWDDPAGAEERYLKEVGALQAGCKPRPASGPAGMNVKALMNAFLVSKRLKVDSGEMTMRTW